MKLMLKELLKDRKIKSCDIARHVGVSAGTMSKYINGTSEPDYKTLCDIADYLNVSIDVLFGRSSETIRLTTEDFQKVQFHLREIEKIYEKYKIQKDPLSKN